jgi:hypothetical protein
MCLPCIFVSTRGDSLTSPSYCSMLPDLTTACLKARRRPNSALSLHRTSKHPSCPGSAGSCHRPISYPSTSSILRLLPSSKVLLSTTISFHITTNSITTPHLSSILHWNTSLSVRHFSFISVCSDGEVTRGGHRDGSGRRDCKCGCTCEDPHPRPGIDPSNLGPPSMLTLM